MQSVGRRITTKIICMKVHSRIIFDFSEKSRSNASISEIWMSIRTRNVNYTTRRRIYMRHYQHKRRSHHRNKLIINIMPVYMYRRAHGFSIIAIFRYDSFCNKLIIVAQKHQHISNRVFIQSHYLILRILI